MTFLLFLLISPHPQPIDVDLIELNHVCKWTSEPAGFHHNHKLEKKFSQIIIWRWTGKHYVVAQWKVVDDKTEVFQGKPTTVHWFDNGGRYWFRSKHFRETYGTIDPEVEHRELVEPNSRRPYPPHDER